MTLTRPTRPRLASAATARGAFQLGKPQVDGLRRPAWRWAIAGALLGGLMAAATQTPASWLAQGVDQATAGRLQLVDANGTVWQGSALLLLTGGPGSRDASVLPSRLDWQLSPSFQGWRLGWQLALAQACCLSPGLQLRLQPGWGSLQVQVQPQQSWVGQWPAAWLQGLGAPWNTVQPGGMMRLVTRDLRLNASAQGTQFDGQAELDLLQLSSRLSTLAALGSYRLAISGVAGSAPQITLQTLEGALQLQGSGQLGPRGLTFRGQASATPGQEPALNNLLNIIGRRQGAASVISIG
jgi:general secretion pathway protein N